MASAFHVDQSRTSKVLEISTLKCEVCQQQQGPLPWVPSTIFFQACLFARLGDQSRRIVSTEHNAF